MGLLPSSTPKEKIETVEIKIPVTRNAEFTKHDAEIHYSDGTVEPVVFDGMKRKKNGINLYKYNGYSDRLRGGFKKESFMFISYNNLKKLEILNRRKASIEYETSEIKEVKKDELNNYDEYEVTNE